MQKYMFLHESSFLNTSKTVNKMYCSIAGNYVNELINKGMGDISVISKGWGVHCQESVRDEGPPILDYM